MQKLFSDRQGLRYVSTAVGPTTGDPDGNAAADDVATSTTCQDAECTSLALKVPSQAAAWASLPAHTNFDESNAGQQRLCWV